jgi:peptide deformylase
VKEKMNLVFYGDDVLREEVKKVEAITPDIKSFISEMFEMMYKSEGVGLAAPQVGKSLAITVIDPSLGEDPSAKIALINPQILERKGEQYEEEGCLSFPSISARVFRPTYIKVRYKTIDGETVEHEINGLLARVYDHEIDHLNGVLFIDHIKGLEKQLLMRKIKKTMNSESWNKAS